MSHNTYTINNEGADVVSYHGANLGILYVGRGESSAYTASLSTGQYFEFYDTNPVNTLGATLTQGASAGWIKSIGLSAGTYEIYVSALVPGSSAGLVGIYLNDGTDYYLQGSFLTRSSSLQNSSLNQVVPSNGHCFVTFSSAVTIKWIIEVITRTPADTGGRISETSFLFIRRLG